MIMMIIRIRITKNNSTNNNNYDNDSIYNINNDNKLSC